MGEGCVYTECNVIPQKKATEKNETFPFVTKRMDLEGITLHEINQRKTNNDLTYV